MELVYTIAVANLGPGTATTVSVTDPLPSGMTLVSVAPSQGSCGQEGGVVTCDLGALAAQASATVTIVVIPTITGTTTNMTTVVSPGSQGGEADDTTFIATPTPTPTRTPTPPAIPVVASPTDPAGIALIIALATALAVLLRVRRRSQKG
jgi:uncharacterized repeat protein (TIGR01451 family)